MAIEERTSHLVLTFPLTAVKAKLRELAEQVHPVAAGYPGDYKLTVRNDELVMTFSREDSS